MIVSAVLKRSISFRPWHVHWLRDQVERFYPEADFRAFTDVPGVGQELKSGLVNQWSKMEAYRELPLDRDVLMLDLDTVLLRRMTMPVPKQGRAICYFSPNDRNQPWGGWILSSPEWRADIVKHFWEKPEFYIDEAHGSDQRYFRRYFRDRMDPINVTHPGELASYKRGGFYEGTPPIETAFVLFHGQPRPFDLDLPWIPKMENVNGSSFERACG
jgi:hypothetical protein